MEEAERDPLHPRQLATPRLSDQTNEAGGDAGLPLGSIFFFKTLSSGEEGWGLR